jgi:hypothetical protein
MWSMFFIPNGFRRSRAKLFTLIDLTARWSKRIATFSSKQLRLWDVSSAWNAAAYRLGHARPTRFRNGGQLSIFASNSSPGWIGPTPDGVPVKITSPGNKVSAWLANATICATE